jgi:predicted transcriptional regulator
MMLALIDAPGEFRRGNVGVFSGREVIHMAPPAERVPSLVEDLFFWLKNAKDHLLIRSCVFHYEFEFIHPFADGNGRIGRLWQSLILSKLHPVFQHLPVETMVHDNQQDYYQAINDSTRCGNSAVFIDFMLGEILSTLRLHKGRRLDSNIDSSEQETPQATQQDTLLEETQRSEGTKSALSRHQVEILTFCEEERSLLEMMARSGRADRTKYKKGVIDSLLFAGFLEYTIPEKPNSRLQKYRLTNKGRTFLKNISAKPTKKK